MKLEGKRVLLTGASRGIGKELAVALGERGAILALSSRRQADLELTKNRVLSAGGERVAVITADLAETGEAQRLASEATEALGGIDVLINNAATHLSGTVWSVGDQEEARRLWETNYWSPLALIAALMPAFLQQKSGFIVNVTSVVQVTTWPRIGIYASSKAASSLVTETLRMELAGSGLRVLNVVPGPVRTPMYEQTKNLPGITRMTGMSPLGDAGVLAGRVVRAIEKGKGRVVYPSVNNVPLHFPRSAQRLLGRISKRSVPMSGLGIVSEHDRSLGPPSPYGSSSRISVDQ